MIKRELVGHEVAPEKDPDQISEWKGRYMKLIDALGKAGSEVRRVRTYVIDVDRHPFHFVKEAFQEFIFPPQAVSLRGRDDDVGDSQHDEDLTAEYDEDKVVGRVKVTYADASRVPQFVLEGSDLPDGIHPIVSEVFDQNMPKELQRT